MFSPVFTLLFAGAMLSQVFSIPVLLVVFDNVNANFISDKMPDLNFNGPIGRRIVRPAFLRSENPTMSFPNLHSIATGVTVKEHGVIANKMFDSEGVEMFNTEKQFTYDKKLIPIWTEAVQAHIKTATFMWPGSNILMQELKPIITEEYKYIPNAEWGPRTRKIIEWFKNDGIQFGMAYFEDTNSMETVDTYNGKVYRAIKEIYNGLKDLEIDIIIMSNHGTKNVQKNHVLNINNYVSETDCNCKVIAGGQMSFIRYNNPRENLLNKKNQLMKENGTQKKYDVYTGYKDFSGLFKWNLGSSKILENTLVVITKNGYTFYDSNKYSDLETSGVNVVRESGFDRDDPEMNGILLFSGPSFNDNVVAVGEIELYEVYSLTKRLLGLNRVVYDIQPFYNLSANMEKLIKPETLTSWGYIRPFVRL